VKNWKEDLVGRINYDESLIQNELSKALVGPTSVCRCLCRQCNNIFEVNEEMATGFLNTMKLLASSPEIILQKKTDFNKWYFEVNYCHLCQREKDVSIKIQQLTKKH